MYGVYDLQNNEICVGIFDNRKDLADFFGKTINIIGGVITRKNKIKKRYIIEIIPEYNLDYENMTILNIKENVLFKNNRNIKLTDIEKDLLSLLSNNQVISSKEIQKYLYNNEKTKLNRVILQRLRNKTKIAIKNKSGHGYYTDEKIYIDF